MDNRQRQGLNSAPSKSSGVAGRKRDKEHHITETHCDQKPSKRPRMSLDSSCNKGGVSLETGESSNSENCSIIPNHEQPLLPSMLPSDEGKHTLVLDMDGTILLELRCELPLCIADFSLLQKRTGTRTFVSQRRGLGSFLLAAAESFEIVIFTESSKRRADVILDMVENSSCIRHRLYRDSCTEINGRLVKDLSRLGRDLSKVIIVDDCPFAYSLQRFNAIPIPWFNGQYVSDRALKILYSFLMEVIKEEDVRIALENEFERQVSEGSNDKNPNFHPEIFYPNVLGPLLPPMLPSDEGKYTLVLDMDGTLLTELPEKLPEGIGSEYFPCRGNPTGVETYVYKRPDVEMFLAKMSQLFEIVIFTASSKLRANTLLEQLVVKRCIRFRLSRDSCIQMYGKFIKDLSLLERDLKKVIIIDDNPVAYELQQSNAIPIEEFIGEKTDGELQKLLPFLKELLRE